LTLRELWNLQLAQDEDELEQVNRAALLAWQIKRVDLKAHRSDGSQKLPDLDGLYVKSRRGRRQTLAEQRTVVYQIAAQLGIPLRRHHGSDDAGRRVTGSEPRPAGVARSRAR
jgi:hypothetical protein